jgi:hypothetical protein
MEGREGIEHPWREAGPLNHQVQLQERDIMNQGVSYFWLS